MRHMLMTAGLATCLAAGVAFAQETQAPAEDDAGGQGETQTTEPQTDQTNAGAEAGEGGGAGGAAEGEGAPLEIEPAGEGESEATDSDAATREGAAGASEDVIVRQQEVSELRVDWITDSTVRSPEGDTIGDVDDLILDRDTGQLTAAILGVGGFLGIGEKKIAVSWNELQIDYDANEITMQLTREEAEAAPEYVFRDQEQPPPPQPVGDAATGTTGGMGTGAPAPTQ